jgi:hypothetical protein
MRDLDEIECFVKAVELKSLTAAAKALKGNEGRVAITLVNRGRKEGW